MKLEYQVIDLDYAKELRELGIEKESYFKYELRSESPLYFEIYHSKATSCAHQYFPAYTVSELLHILPSMINGAVLELVKGALLSEYKIIYCARYYNADLIGEYQESAANALAVFLIYLIEHGLVKVEDLNGTNN